MTGAVLDRPSAPFTVAGGAECGGRPLERGRATLEDVLTGVLQEARTNGVAECPLCHARMTLTRAHAECAGCGSRLS
jgi:hypothetical protein